ncbi:MAG: hypothetical protein ACLR2G_04775 [Phascolarctobacterium faecium]
MIAAAALQGAKSYEDVLFKIPKEQREGKLPLTVRGGSSLAWIQNLLRKQREEGVPHSRRIIVKL